MYEMSIDDALYVANVVSDLLTEDAVQEFRDLAIAAKRLVRHVEEQSRELERERARRYGRSRGSARLPDGHALEEGTDGGGRRDFLAGRPVHAGEILFLLTGAGWHVVRYESNMPRKEPVLYIPLPGVRQDVVITLPREARFAWPDQLG